MDLYPTVAKLCDLEAPDHVQGKDISRMLDDPKHEVRDAAFSVAPMRKGFLLREHRYAYIQYGEDASGGIELFDTEIDSIREFEVEDMPVTVAVDSSGDSVHESGPKKWRAEIGGVPVEVQ